MGEARKMAAVRVPLYTPKEYLEYEKNATYKSEYISGEIFAMAGGTLEHNMIVGDTYRSLGNRLQAAGDDCDAHTSDQRVRIEQSGPFFYPDISVVCGDAYVDEDECLYNPSLIVEVLSPSTEHHDRGEKFRNYRRLPSLRHYLLIDATQVRVEHYQLSEENGWQMAGDYRTLSDSVRLSDMAIEIPLREIYRRVSFP
jgi:Uma2 family endonuclease